MWCQFTARKSGKETTAALRQRQQVDLPEQPRVVAAPPVSAKVGRSIMLVVLNSGRRMTLDTGEDILIGRKDNARGIFPDVDLGLDGGYDAGVSRDMPSFLFSRASVCCRISIAPMVRLSMRPVLILTLHFPCMMVMNLHLGH